MDPAERGRQTAEGSFASAVFCFVDAGMEVDRKF
jgi:hypothetical protein